MPNRLVSVDDNLNLPPEVQEQLTNNVRTEFLTYLDDAEDAAGAAEIAATAASGSASTAAGAAATATAAAESVTIPTNEMVVDALVNNGVLTAANGRAFKVVAGTIRNTGTGWTLLSDANHQAVNITSVSANDTAITINYGFTALKVASLVVSPDETYAQQGILCGASVGLSSSTIHLSKVTTQTISDYVQYTGTEWTSASGVYSGFSFSGGTLTMSHTSVLGTGASVASRAGSSALAAYLNSVGPTTTQVQWYNASQALVTTASTSMRAYVSRHGPAGLVNVDPTTLVNASGNLWIFGIVEIDPNTLS